MSSPTAADPNLESVAWDLSPLVEGSAEPGAAIDAMLGDGQRRADRFAAAYAGKVAELDADGLVAAMRELEGIHDIVGRAGSYAMLCFSVDTADPAIGALLQ